MNNDDADSDSNNEIQSLSISGKTISISNGNSIDLPDQINIWTENNGNVYRNSGKVGIGTNSPVESITVKTKTTNSTIAFQNNSSGSTSNDGLHIGINPSSHAYIWNKEKERIIFGTDNKERLIITSNGSVGIGTTNPVLPLSVGGDGNSNAAIFSKASGATGRKVHGVKYPVVKVEEYMEKHPAITVVAFMVKHPAKMVLEFMVMHPGR